MRSAKYKICKAFANQFYGELRAKRSPYQHMERRDAVDAAVSDYMAIWDSLNREEIQQTMRDVLIDAWWRCESQQPKEAPDAD